MLVVFAKLAYFGHDVSDSPCEYFPLFLAFVCVLFPKIFVGLHRREHIDLSHNLRKAAIEQREED
jgi:hypothetical protein